MIAHIIKMENATLFSRVSLLNETSLPNEANMSDQWGMSDQADMFDEVNLIDEVIPSVLCILLNSLFSIRIHLEWIFS